MPLDTTVALYVQELARRHAVPLSQARRMLIEQLDLARRREVSERAGRAGLVSGRGAKKVEAENPFRTFVSPSDEPPPSTVKKYQGSHSKKQVKSPEPEPGQSPSLKTPATGTMSAIIYGELIDPEKDFTQAFNSLRNMPRFDHLRDSELRQRMFDLQWRYEIKARKELLNP